MINTVGSVSRVSPGAIFLAVCVALGGSGCNDTSTAPPSGNPDLTHSIVAAACTTAAGCGDGYVCRPAAQAWCTKSCVVGADCPGDSVCAGIDGASLCHRACRSQDDCPTGFTCTRPTGEALSDYCKELPGAGGDMMGADGATGSDGGGMR